MKKPPTNQGLFDSPLRTHPQDHSHNALSQCGVLAYPERTLEFLLGMTS